MRKISATGTPLMYALVTEAPLTLCALKTEVSMPALDRTDLIHLPTVEVCDDRFFRCDDRIFLLAL